MNEADLFVVCQVLLAVLTMAISLEMVEPSKALIFYLAGTMANFVCFVIIRRKRGRQ